MSTDKLRCVVLEDEDDIRQWLVSKLRAYPELEIVGEAAGVDEAFNLIAAARPEIAFMDIQLVGGDAFALLSRLQEYDLPIPHTVLVTGYPEHVLTALNNHRRYVVQYLVKPFVENWETKLRKAIDALIVARMQHTVPATTSLTERNFPDPAGAESIFIKDKGLLLRLDFDQISYLEAAGGGDSILIMDGITYQLSRSLNKFAELLPDHFLRISKTNIVNIRQIVSLNRGERTIKVRCKDKTKTLGITRTYYTKVVQHLPVVGE